MHNYFKIMMLLTVLIFSLTACKAVPQKDMATDEPATVNQTDEQGLPAETETTVVSEEATNLNYTAGEWITDHQKALALSAETGKPVLANFTGSDWCIWCKRLSSEVFTKKEFIDFAKDNLILLKLDFPRNLPQTTAEKQQNEALAKQFSITGFPTILILDKVGKEVARTGYQQGGADSYIQHLQELIK